MRAIAAAIFLLAASPATAAPANVTACFTPGQDCEGRIVAEISRARADIRVQAYGLTSTAILRALRDAIGRGVAVRAVLDRTNAAKRYGSAEYLRMAGAEVWIDDAVSIAHNKVIVIDWHEVIGGSFNYTRAAQTRNAENVTFIDSREVAGWYLANWNARRDASRRYGAP